MKKESNEIQERVKIVKKSWENGWEKGYTDGFKDAIDKLEYILENGDLKKIYEKLWRKK